MTSAVPGTLTALVTLFQSAFGGLAEVFDGPPGQQSEPDAWVSVGHDPYGNEPEGVEVEWNRAGLDIEQETFDVLCVLMVRSGNQDMRPLRERAYALLDVAQQAMADADPLDPRVVSQRLSVVGLLQDMNQTGAACWLRFRVACIAYA